MQQELAQVLQSVGAGQQATALLRNDVAHDAYYKVGHGGATSCGIVPIVGCVQ